MNRATGLLLALLTWAPLAAAQVPLDDSLDEHAVKRLDRMEKAMKELRAIIFQGRETGQLVVVQPAETPAQIASLADKVGDVEQSLARLNGQLEVMRHDLDQSRHENLDLRAENTALKGQLAGLDQKVVALTPPPTPPPPPDPVAAYAAAKAAYLAGDTASAEAGFRDYLDRFPDTANAAEGRYYLGKALIARRNWPEAATADIGAIRGWPKTRWAADALVDLARSLTALNKQADACASLVELAKRYPKPAPSVTAAAAEVRAAAKCG